MINEKSFAMEHIESIRSNKKVDINLLERSIYAFGLLEALVRVGLPFIFKGGTSLMLLLDKPKRLSTDIDIIVKPGTEVEDFIKQASKIIPFKDYKKQTRKGKNNIEKVHYQFFYDSPVYKREFYILLDILFEENNYERLIQKNIKNEILLTEEPYLNVTLPTVDCVLGDKLTAFAPHTTGIRFGEDKDLEVIKQMFDVACLFDNKENFEDIRKTYFKTSAAEIEYRGLEISPEAALMDTIDSAACIVGRGKFGTEYPLYSAVMKSLTNHIYDGSFSGEIAAVIACKVMYIAACVLKNKEPIIIDNPNTYLDVNIGNTKYGKLSFIRKYNAEAFAYVVETVTLLEKQ